MSYWEPAIAVLPAAPLPGTGTDRHRHRQLHCAGKSGAGRKTTSAHSTGFFSPLVLHQGYSPKQARYALSLALSLGTSNFLAGTSTILDFTALQETFVRTDIIMMVTLWKNRS